MDTRAKYEHIDRERLIGHCVAMDEALARVRQLCMDLRVEAVDGGMTDCDTLWPIDVLDAIAGGGNWTEGDEHVCRCGHPSLREHNAGGCKACGCTSPYGGTT